MKTAKIADVKKLIPLGVLKLAQKEKASIKLPSSKVKKSNSRKSTRKNSTNKSKSKIKKKTLVKKSSSRRKSSSVKVETKHHEYVVKRHILAVMSSRLFYSMVSTLLGTGVAATIVSDPLVRRNIITLALATTQANGLNYWSAAYSNNSLYYWIAVAAISSAVQSVFALLYGHKFARYKRLKI